MGDNKIDRQQEQEKKPRVEHKSHRDLLLESDRRLMADIIRRSRKQSKARRG